MAAGGSAKIMAEGKTLGFGFPITTRLAVTARHIVAGHDPASLTFAPNGSPEVQVVGVRDDLDLDIAILELTLDVPAPLLWAKPKKKAEWSVDARWKPNDPLLTGTVTAVGLPIRLKDAKADVDGMQLDVNENLHNFRGYSGGPVIVDDECVVGVLVEQVRTREELTRGAPQQFANVLWAVPISSVIERFGIEAGRAARLADQEIDRLRLVVGVDPVSPSITGLWLPNRPFAHEPNTFVDKVQFSPDGSLLATAGTDQTVRLWSVTDDDHVPEHPLRHADPVRNLLFSGDGMRLASVAGKRAGVWEVPGLGDPIWEFQHDRTIFDFSLAPDGRMLALADGDDGSVIVNLQTGAVINLDQYVFCVRFSPDGRHFATYSTSTGVCVWRLVGGELRRPVPIHVLGEGKVKDLTFSPSGRWLMVQVGEPATFASPSRHPQTVWVHNSHLGNRVGSVRHDNGVAQLATSPDDELLGTASFDKTVRVWRIGSSIEPVEIPLQDIGVGVGFGPDNSFVAVASYNPNARVWRMDGSGPQILEHDHPVQAIAVSRNGLIATASANTAVVWSSTS